VGPVTAPLGPGSLHLTPGGRTSKTIRSVPAITRGLRNCHLPPWDIFPPFRSSFVSPHLMVQCQCHLRLSLIAAGPTSSTWEQHRGAGMQVWAEVLATVCIACNSGDHHAPKVILGEGTSQQPICMPGVGPSPRSLTCPLCSPCHIKHHVGLE
jgi:hypothetical protein